jgi:hypothetical protein
MKKLFKSHQKSKTLSNINLNPEMEFDEVVQLYNHIAEEERHFNSMELDYRKLASQWLLVTFSAVGIILGNNFVIPNGLLPSDLIIIISMLSSIGIFVIFIVDIKAYHGLLHEAFKQGIALEMKYNQKLPPIRINMLIAAKDGDIVNWVVLFYFFSISSLFVISNCAIYYSSIAILPIYVHLFSIILLAVLYLKMRIVPREIDGLEQYIANNN